MNRRLLLSTLILGSLLVLAAPAQAQPNADSLDERQKWMGETYVPSRQADMDRLESEVKNRSEHFDENKKPDYWRGNDPAEAQNVAEQDEFKIRDGLFEECNDGRISELGDPEEESRQGISCDQQSGFFDPANVIPFTCYDSQTSNSCGDDADTGSELVQFCAQNSGACGDHSDNRHPGEGGMTGIAIMEVGPDPDGPYLPCQYYVRTATFVEYYFPWTMVNVSRNMYQSTYLSSDVVKDVIPVNRQEIADAAQTETLASIQIAQEAVKNNIPGSDGGSSSSSSSSSADIVKDVLDSIEKNYSDEKRDFSPGRMQMFARNFSTTMDIRFQQYVYNDVPHYPLDSHRFGTDLPLELQSIDIPMPTGTYEPLELSENQSKGGVLHARFISKSRGGESSRLSSYLDKLIAGGGPTICLRHGMATGKAPSKLSKDSSGGSSGDNRFAGLDPEEDNDRFCISKIGPRFNTLMYSFSPYLTDGVWRAFLSGGEDLFYAINYPEHYDYGPRDPLPLGEQSGTFHTFFDEFDRVSVNPNPASSSQDFIDENPGCKAFKDMVKYNHEYQKANIEDPYWGAQNTLLVWGYVKAAYGFRGQIPLAVIFYGDTLHGEVQYRFR